jgi:hypothetical protein
MNLRSVTSFKSIFLSKVVKFWMFCKCLTHNHKLIPIGKEKFMKRWGKMKRKFFWNSNRKCIFFSSHTLSAKWIFLILIWLLIKLMQNLYWSISTSQKIWGYFIELQNMSLALKNSIRPATRKITHSLSSRQNSESSLEDLLLWNGIISMVGINQTKHLCFQSAWRKDWTILNMDKVLSIIAILLVHHLEVFSSIETLKFLKKMD